MADFEAPSGPPPPKVPEGWVARWNDQYHEWFYVNLHTKKSQWDVPTEPARPAQETGPDGPPPTYLHDPNRPALTDSKKSHLESNNPYNMGGSSTDDEDAKLAARLQAEEDARARKSSDRGAGQDYYNQGSQYVDPNQGSPGSYPQQLPPRPQDTSRGSGGGFLGKLLGKGKHSSQSYQGSPSPQPQYGGYPQQQFGGGYPQQPGPYGGYGGYGPGGYPPQGYPQQQPPRKSGGLGAGGGLALGLGGGLLGGALLGSAMDGGDDGGGDGGGDYGGGDGGGGDFGGGDGGGGGDF